MKLLLDENLSHHIVKPLLAAYPESMHVKTLGLNGANDRAIWNCARDDGYVLVTFDSDFRHYAMQHDKPPLVVWLRCNNEPRRVILDILLTSRDLIEKAHDDPATWMLEIE